MKKFVVVVIVLLLSLLCCGCSLHEECEEEINELEILVDELQWEVRSLEEDILLCMAKSEEYDGYYSGDYSSYMDEDEAYGFLLYAQDLCREMANGTFGMAEDIQEESETSGEVTYEMLRAWLMGV